MKLGKFGKMITTVLCVTLLMGEVLPTVAASISGGDAPVSVSGGNSNTVSGNTTEPEGAEPLSPALYATRAEGYKLTINHYLGEGAAAKPLFLPEELGPSVAPFLEVKNFLKEYKDQNSAKYHNAKSILLSDGTNTVDIKDYITYVSDDFGVPVEQIDFSALKNSGAVIDLEAAELTMNVYYEEAAGNLKNSARFFDYVNGSANDSRSINYEGNYPVGSAPDNRIATQGAVNQYQTLVAQTNPESLLVNNGTVAKTLNIAINDYWRTVLAPGRGGWTSESMGYFPIITGLLKGVYGSELQTVEFTHDDPGFFSDEAKNGKTIINGYDIGFTRNGMKYVIDAVYDEKDTVVWSNAAGGKGQGQGYDFFPLNEVDNVGGNNEYFGMRYDFTFSLHDYVGDLNYKFIGDDDLWVCLNGAGINPEEQVILDLGGIHDPYPALSKKLPNDKAWTRDIWHGQALAYAPNVVNIWETLLGGAEDTLENRMNFVKQNGDNVYTITVLFMERGGSESNCYMEFVLPNLQKKEPVVTTVPTGELTLKKVDGATGLGMSDVEFTLYRADNSVVAKTKTDTAGTVTFTGLVAGNTAGTSNTYFVRETQTIDGYIVDTTGYTVTVTNNGNNTATTTANIPVQDGQYVVANYRKPTVSFIKVDADNNSPLTGAKFALTDAVGSRKEAISDGEGRFSFTDLEPGVYTLTETVTPEGYEVPAGESIQLQVNAKGEYTVTGGGSYLTFDNSGDTVIIKNKQTVDVTIIKAWQNFKGEALTEEQLTALGITEIGVTLYRKQGGTRDAAFKQDITLTAADNWKALIENLDYKNANGVWEYEVEETVIPEGFQATCEASSKNLYQVTLELINTQQPGAMKITKSVDEVNAAYGDASFTFKVTCPDGEVLYRVLNFAEAGTKEVVINNLLPGAYVVEELDTVRYTCLSENPQAVNVKAGAAAEQAVAAFANELSNDDNYSHSDMVVNSFRRNASGKVEISKNLQVIE